MTTARLLTCNGCASSYDVSRRTPGKQVRCPKCRTVLVVPDPDEAPARDLRLSSSSRLRRAKGATCRDHPRELATARCHGCAADVCERCRADSPVEHFCRGCAATRELGSALPTDFGLLATPLLALRALGGALGRMLAWNLAGLVLVVLVFTPLMAIGFAGWDREAPPAAVDLWRAVKADLFAGLVLGGAGACLATYYGLLVPAGCSVFLDAALRGRQVPFGAAFGQAWRRVTRTGPSLIAVSLLLILAFSVAVVAILALAYPLREVGQGRLSLALVGALGAPATLAFFTALGLVVPVVVLEERSALEGLARAWTLARWRLWDVAILVVGYGAAHLVFSLLLWRISPALGGLLLPGLLTLLGHVVDLIWPALLVATYHGLAAEEAGIVGRH